MNLFIIADAKGTARRTGIFRSLGLVLAACAVLALMQPGRASAAGFTGMAAVTAAKLNIRQSASNNSHVVAVLSKGDVVKVLSSSGTWYRVTASGGKSGWCQSRYLASAVYSGSLKSGNTASLDWPSQYIDLSIPFTWQRCMQDMNELANTYSNDARIETIGTTVMGNPINAIVLGNPDADTKIFFQASIHARESIASLLALRQVECMLKDASINASYRGMKIADLLNNVEIWVVPMSNPDGVRLVYEGLAAVPPSMPQLAASLKSMNHGSTNFIRWKANAHGVDLNRNFDANWKIDPNYIKPGSQNYSGPKPFSEPEATALRDLALAKDFALTASYHSSGEMIYWYDSTGGPNDLNLFIANGLKSLTGYTVLPSSAQAPGGGYRDWYVAKYKRPGLTIEIGSGYCPLPQSQFNALWQDDRYIMLDLLWTVAPKSLTAIAR